MALDNALLKRIADNIRVLAVAMPETAKSGHPGGAMGGADFMALLYTEFLNFDPSDMSWPHRDRFFQDAGHLSSMMYGTLSLFGKYSMQELSQFRQWESPTPGHPERDVKRGLENTSGPLGQGHVMGAGAAIAERVLSDRFGAWTDHKTVCYITDGGVEEEASQGVGRIAGHLGLSNLIMFYDANEVQLSHMVKDTMTEDTAKKYEAWGWAVETVDGHDFDAMRAALKRAWARTDKPTFILGRTIMGRGAIKADGTKYEGSPKLHGNPISKSEANYEATLKLLGCADCAAPFAIFDDVKAVMDKVIAEKTAKVASLKKAEKDWAAQNPELAKKLASWLKGELPKLDWSAVPQKGGEATRAASKNVLEYLHGKVENLVVMSADLADSDYTEGFLKKTKIFRKGDFSGSFLQAGVAELTMAGIMNGIALHGGLIPVGGTFFVFSDFQKPAIRLAALQEAKVIFLWSHDAFRVGEDGPTHEPIEQEAQLRLLERLNNLEGKRSFLALRPGDASETTIAWKLALEAHGPSSLVLTRQPVAELPPTSNSRFEDASKGMPKGAYVVVDCEGKPDLILLANGSEASLLVEGAEKLKAKGLKVRVVSAPSEGLFRDQTESYRDSVTPFGLPVLGWTAGEPSTLRNLVGPLGKVYGMTRFGASAPFKVLDEKFGYTADNVVKVAEEYLAEYKANVKKIVALA
ncbi:MAG TPA: transketolase [Fibrobacteria bacterium]|nr:transketolase [Fibrobacteria bacterium]